MSLAIDDAIGELSESLVEKAKNGSLNADQRIELLKALSQARQAGAIDAVSDSIQSLADSFGDGPRQAFNQG